MTNRAILIGNATYGRLQALPCCHDDVVAMRRLLDATAKYDEIEVIENADADDLKSRLRAFADRGQPAGEIFLYFTGHGHQHEAEFFFCAANFDAKRPNETGLSTTELHTLLRLANADLVVKVIDACHSGTLLVKVADALNRQSKEGFTNLVQIASCLDSQTSLTGDPLSIFTEKFISSALRKAEGTVYYTDIMNTLRDEAIDDQFQTPHFIAQGTGREVFVENAKQLDGLRNTLQAEIAPQAQTEPPQTRPRDLTLAEVLAEAEEKMATPERIKCFVDGLFDALKQKASTQAFAEIFATEIVEHDTFREGTTRGFIIRVLSKETRSDNFVTAEIKQERRRRNPWEMAGIAAMLAYNDYEMIETFDLDLTCKMERAQIKITFTPKFHSLKRLQLVVTCAPSLDTCYVFELGTQHALRNFGEYDAEGSEFVRRWYKFSWDESTDGVVEKITAKLSEAINAHVEATSKRLDANKDG